MKPLLVAVVLLLSAPAWASAALEIHFNIDQDPNGVERGQFLAKDGPLYTAGPIGIALERDGQIVEVSPRDIGYSIIGLPLAGDRLHVLVNGVERAIVAYDGRPVLDGACSPEGATVTGSFTPGSSLEVARWPGLSERAAVVTDGDRFTATFPLVLHGAALGITSHSTQPALDGSPVDVYVRRSTTVSCAVGISGPRKVVKLGISRDKLRKVPVDRRGRYKLTTRLRCPAELPTCRVVSGAYVYTRDSTRSLGTIRYSVPGGTNRRMHGRLKPRALAALRRRGSRPVQFLIVILPPDPLPDGIAATGLHGGYPGTLLAPR